MQRGRIVHGSPLSTRSPSRPHPILLLPQTLTCLAELPCFWFVPALISRLGTTGTLAVAFVFYIIRFASYSALHNPWLVLLVEPCHGFTYAVLWSACVSKAHEIAPSGLGATTMGLLNGTHWGLGQGLGALAAGFIYDARGPRVMFRLGALMCAFGLALLLVSHYCHRYEQGFLPSPHSGPSPVIFLFSWTCCPPSLPRRVAMRRLQTVPLSIAANGSESDSNGSAGPRTLGLPTHSDSNGHSNGAEPGSAIAPSRLSALVGMLGASSDDDSDGEEDLLLGI